MAEYATLREKIAAESAARKTRNAEWAALLRKADEAGRLAAEAATPTPMVVRDARTGQEWAVEDGVCGFGWVHVRDGRSAFARWALKEGHRWARDSYHGGVTCWSPMQTQSMARNEAWAKGFARVLVEAGIDAVGRSRID